jgi:hypothetical protein
MFWKIPRLVALQEDQELGRISLLFDSEFPFTVRQIYHLCGIPVGTTQVLPGNKLSHRFVTPISGVIDITINENTLFHLDMPSLGLYIPPESDAKFSSGAGTVMMIAELRSKMITAPTLP